MRMRFGRLLVATLGLGLCQQVVAAPIVHNLYDGAAANVQLYNADSGTIWSTAFEEAWSNIVSGTTVDAGATPNTIAQYTFDAADEGLTAGSTFDLDEIVLSGYAQSELYPDSSHLDLAVSIWLTDSSGSYRGSVAGTQMAAAAGEGTANDNWIYYDYPSFSLWSVDFTGGASFALDIDLNDGDRLYFQFYELDKQGLGAEHEAKYLYTSTPEPSLVMTLVEGTGTNNPLPEPASLLLLGMGLFGMGLARRRR